MNHRAISMISYLSLVGWFIAFFSTRNNRSVTVRFHLKQSFGLMIVCLVLGVLINITAIIMPSLEQAMLMTWLAVPLLWLTGAVNAWCYENRPLPLLGKLFDKSFEFIQ